jgi:ubiquinone/menaquinone biosynthesis C-methylase UbiE
MTTVQTKSKYVPALRFRALTRFYEPLVRLTLKDAKLKAMIVEALGVEGAMRVVDIGCGPGTLAIGIARAYPSASVSALDGDPEILSLAREKARAAGVMISFAEGLATAPPFERGTFDRVVTSLVLHHLSPGDKRTALRAMFDLLQPGGRLLVADWGEARSLVMRAAFLSVQLLDGFGNTRDHVAGKLPLYLREAGFASVEEIHRESTLYGIVSFYRGERPTLPDRAL